MEPADSGRLGSRVLGTGVCTLAARAGPGQAPRGAVRRFRESPSTSRPLESLRPRAPSAAGPAAQLAVDTLGVRTEDQDGPGSKGWGSASSAGSLLAAGSQGAGPEEDGGAMAANGGVGAADRGCPGRGSRGGAEACGCWGGRPECERTRKMQMAGMAPNPIEVEWMPGRRCCHRRCGVARSGSRMIVRGWSGASGRPPAEHFGVRIAECPRPLRPPHAERSAWCHALPGCEAVDSARCGAAPGRGGRR
jgi:hypothetical protein